METKGSILGQHETHIIASQAGLLQVQITEYQHIHIEQAMGSILNKHISHKGLWPPGIP